MTDVRISKQAQKFLHDLPPRERRKIVEVLQEMKDTPFPPRADIKKVKGMLDTYRIRIGIYRIIYHIDWRENVIYVMKIDKRSRVYNRV